MNLAFLIILTFLNIIPLQSNIDPETPVTKYSDKSKILSLGRNLSFYEDRASTLKAINLDTLRGFTKSKKDVLNLGVSSSCYWLKFSILNISETDRLAIEVKFPLLEEVSLYQFAENGKFKVQLASTLLPFESRSSKNENYEFAVHQPVHSLKTYYIRIKSNSQIIIPIYIGSEPAIMQSQTKENFIYGIYFGIILGMILYNSFLFISVRDKSYLFYVIYIIFVALSQAVLGGFAFRYLWPELPWIARQSIVVIPALNGIAVAEFFKRFLNTKQLLPRKHFILTVFNSVYILIFLLSIFSFIRLSTILLNITGLAGTLTLMLFCGELIHKHYRPATFFMIAWSFFFISIIVFVLTNFNVLPFNFLTDHILLLGSGAEVALLSFALADRINILKKEKEASQHLALTESIRNEQLIRDQNVTLEDTVDRRTTQLRKAVQDLNTTMDDLKNTQAQLVDSEKMASLGQLTAGIAHEINNPINFVTSNINPLKRDIQDIYKLLGHYEKENSAMDPAFQKTVTALKKELDIDYVKNEIDLLLKGIDEGANRTSEIIKGLKKFSRVDEQDIKEVDLNEGFESTLLLLNSKLKDHIKLNLLFGELPMIECYAGKLNQVFMNIISNSIYAINKRFDDKSGGELTVETLCNKSDKSNVHIRIKDNGTGMPEEIRAQIFDPFFTTKPVGEGTGLGLSIVKKIITGHQGTIEVTSNPGEGTEFKICLPVQQQTKLTPLLND